MKPPTSPPRTQLQLSLEPPVPAAPHSAALMRALAVLLLEALGPGTVTADPREAADALLSPGHFVAMDKPYNAIAERYRDEVDPNIEVVHFPRKRDAHSERNEVLRDLARRAG